MIIEMAPMEGITNYLYRQIYQEYFGGIDRFYTPFLSPNQHDSFQSKEWKEIDPNNNAGLRVIPQILTKNPDHFLWAAKVCYDKGYPEVNYNLGCPSGTVVAKGKGAGTLRDVEELDRILDKVFASCPAKVSIKTRIGLQDPEEFEKILKVYQRYPLERLIIHPRVQKEFYKGSVHLESFALAYERLSCPLVFNGNLFSPEDIQRVLSLFPHLEGVMLGRGLLSRPSLAEEIHGVDATKKGLTMGRFYAFHQALVERNKEVLSGDHQVLHRMKEFWPYWYIQFTNGEKYWKKVRKARYLSDYLAATNDLFQKESLAANAYFSSYSIR